MRERLHWRCTGLGSAHALARSRRSRPIRGARWYPSLNVRAERWSLLPICRAAAPPTAPFSNTTPNETQRTSSPGGYEREAIRPHVLGRFVDMLQALESHPAMLLYLNNAQSIGPNSVAGLNRDRGLSENLAREILELHTLGVRTGYSQADVTNFA